MTNGEKCLNQFVGPEYGIQRRKESIAFIQSVNPNIQIHFINIPDGMNDWEFVHGFGADVFRNSTHQSRSQYVVGVLKEIVRDNIVVTCEKEEHVTHMLCYGIVECLKNPKIYYNVWNLQNNQVLGELPFCPMVVQDKDGNRSILYKFTLEEYKAKVKLFWEYYHSQAVDLSKSNIILPDIELYWAPKGVECKLCTQ